MACLNSEQLAAIALGVDDAAGREHIEQCATCRRALVDIERISQELAEAHVHLSGDHAASRERLLAGLPSRQSTVLPAIGWNRVAFGGLGLSAAIAALLLLAVFANSSSQLSAMERISNALRDVSSFSYKMLNTTEQEPRNGKPARTLYGSRYIFWRSPPESEPEQFGDFRASMTNEWVYHLATGDQEPVVTLELLEIHPTGKPGLLIDYVHKKYFRTMPLRATDIKNSPPLLWMRAVQKKAGRIIDDRGTRQINGRDAHGYVMTFDDAEPFKGFGPVEVWVDPQTDLPVEFYLEWKNQDGDDFDDRYAVTDIQWNVAIDPQLFDVTPPAGFVDTTLPKDEKTIAQVVDALKVYSRRSDGQYPPVTLLDVKELYRFQFDAAEAHHAMLEKAGFVGPVQDKWKADPKYVEIENSLAGLKELERILQNHMFLVGYNGDTVGPQDKDKVLMWWGYDTGDDRDLSLLVYGDLRTEIVPREKWLPHVSKEIADATE